MKILIFSQYFWPEEFRINAVAETLMEKGAEVEVLTGKPNYPAGEIFPGHRAWGCRREMHQNIWINRIPMLARGHKAWRLAANYLGFVLSGIVVAPWLLRGKSLR